ncbi:MAG: tetratricopeptide repeat protein [Pyrinomonadaceae bacterium]
MNSKEKALLAGSALAIVGGVMAAPMTAGVSLIAPAILQEGLKALAGLGTEVTGSIFDNCFLSTSPQDDVLKNGDLTRAIGSAVFKLCGQLAEETTNKNDKNSLEKLAKTPLETWENLVLGGGYKEGVGITFSEIDLSELSAERSVQYFDAKAESLDEIKTLTPQAWQNVIDALCQEQTCLLSQSAKEELGEKLHNEFARALRKVLIDDFAKDGKAFASMQFRLLSEILNETKRSRELSESLREEVVKLSEKIDAINLTAPPAYRTDNKQEWEQIFSDFESFRTTLNATYQNTEQLITTQAKHGETLIEILERQRNQPKTKPKGLINISRDGKASFTEQGSVLEDLEAQLKNRHIACLHGKHGLGKTTNALEFARRQAGNYEFIVFLNSADHVIERSIAEFADNFVPVLAELSLLDREQIQSEKKLKLFKAFLEDIHIWQGEKRAWLLIFDNLENRDHIVRYFPDRNNGDVLYTCNDDLWIDNKCEVPIYEFSQSESELFLFTTKDEQRRTKHEDIPPQTLVDIQKILTEYGRLPFVLNKFRNYLCEIRISYAIFYQELRNNEQRYLEAASNIDYQYKNEIMAFSVSFERIATPEDDRKDSEIISHLAVAILNISAFCFPDQIPEEFLNEILFRMIDTSGSAISQDVLFAEAMRKLERFDLLNAKNEIFEYQEKDEILDVAGSQITVEYSQLQTETKLHDSHRIVQKIVKLLLDDDTKREILEEITIVLSYWFPEAAFESFDFFRKYSPHAISVIRESKSLGVATDEMWRLCVVFGNYFEYMEIPNVTEFLCEYQVEISEKLYSKWNANIGTSYCNLAGAYLLQGKHEDAKLSYLKAKEIYEKGLDKDDEYLGILYLNIGGLYIQLGDFYEAEGFLKEGISILSQTGGENHRAIAGGYHHLGRFYLRKNKLEDASYFAEKSLELRLRVLGKTDLHTGHSHSLLADIKGRQNENEEALRNYRTALDIYEKVLPPDNIRTKTVREDLARIEIKMSGI